MPNDTSSLLSGLTTTLFEPATLFVLVIFFAILNIERNGYGLNGAKNSVDGSVRDSRHNQVAVSNRKNDGEIPFRLVTIVTPTPRSDTRLVDIPC